MAVSFEGEQHEKAAAVPEAREAISAFVICFNEEEYIADCLKSLSFCDEIIVIDSFSSDRTIEICTELGARVIQRRWPGYREQKAFGLAEAAHEWVLNVDADERVSPELRQSILGVLREAWRKKQRGEQDAEDNPVAYSVSRVVYYLGRWWRRGGWYPEYRVRLMRKSRTAWGGVDPHEKPIIHGRVAQLSGEIQHFTYRNIHEQLERLNAYSSVAAAEEYKRGRRTSLALLIFNPLLRMVKFYILKKGYREGLAGLVVSVIEGYYTFMKYAKLWEQAQGESSKEKGDASAPGNKG
jgi:glycosyltransferase involved in cell wall biosynthesis